MKQLKGFTLIELMVVITIIAILAAVGYPSYIESVRKSRREEGKAMLLEMAGQQQRFFTTNNQYTSDLTQLGYTSPFLSENEYYAISVDTTGFVVATGAGNRIMGYTLTAVPEKDQVNDRCGSFTYNSQGAKDIDTSTSLASNPLAAEDCW